MFKSKHVQAIEEYTQILKFNPRHAWILYQRGLSHLELGHFFEALSDLIFASTLNPAYRPHAEKLIDRCKKRLAC